MPHRALPTVLLLAGCAAASAAIPQTEVTRDYPISNETEYHFVAVEVNEFKRSPTAPLAGGDYDARAVADRIQTAWPDMKFRTQIELVDGDADSDTVAEDIERVLKNAARDDVVILYFNTHGLVEGARNQGYLMTADTEIEGRASATALSISKALEKNIQETSADSILVVADVCHEPIDGYESRTGPEHCVERQLSALDIDPTKNWYGFVSPSEERLEGCEGRQRVCNIGRILTGRPPESEPIPRVSSTQPAGAQSGGLDVQLAGADGTLSGGDFEVCFKANGAPVSKHHTFRTGDVFGLDVTTPDPGYLYIVNVDAVDKAYPLFPWGNQDNRVEAGRTYSIPPAGGNIMKLNDDTGEERVYFLWSAAPIQLELGELTALAESWAESDDPQIAIADSWDDISLGKQKGIVVQEDEPQLVQTVASTSGDPCAVHTPIGVGDGWAFEVILQHDDAL